jgi:hypothetical protein
MNKRSLLVDFRLVGSGLVAIALTLLPAKVATAATVNLSFTQLPGLTGGSPAATGVYYADLSSIGFDISSLLITDSNSGVGGSSGQFSGFDFDGIKISDTLISDAADINALSGLNVFDFSSAGTFLTPGTQRLPADPNLFGTSGGNIDNAVATLQSFDGNSTTGLTAFGFASLGDGGQAGFNFTSAVSTATPRYLYIGEVGDNGEVVNGQVTVSDQPLSVPEPTSLVPLSLLGIYFAVRCNQTKKTV